MTRSQQLSYGGGGPPQTGDNTDTIIGQTEQSQDDARAFVEGVTIATKTPVVTYLSKLMIDPEDAGRNVMKWHTGALELWFGNSTANSEEVYLRPVLSYPGISNDVRLDGVSKELKKGGKLAAEFASTVGDGANIVTIFSAVFSVTRADDGDLLTGHLDFQSATMGNFKVDTPLFKIHDHQSKK